MPSDSSTQLPAIGPSGRRMVGVGRLPSLATWSNSIMKRARRIPHVLIFSAVSKLRNNLADLLLKIPEGDPIDTERGALPSGVSEADRVPNTLRSEKT